MGVTIDYYGKLFAENVEITPAVARAANIAKTYGLAVVRARTPVDTGELKGSWTARLEGNGIRWSNSAPYAGFVEFGTRKMEPRAMLTNSLPDIEAVFAEALVEEVGVYLAGDFVAPGDTPGYGNAGVSTAKPGKYPEVGNNLQPKQATGLHRRDANTSKKFLFVNPADILNKKQKASIRDAVPLMGPKGKTPKVKLAKRAKVQGPVYTRGMGATKPTGRQRPGSRPAPTNIIRKPFVKPIKDPNSPYN